METEVVVIGSGPELMDRMRRQAAWLVTGLRLRDGRDRRAGLRGGRHAVHGDERAERSVVAGTASE